MSLINQAGAIVLTDVQKQATAVARLKTINTDVFNYLVKQFTTAYDVVWNNKDGLTPQQVLDAVGTDATQLFIVSGKTQDLVNTVVPNTLPQTALQVPTFNQDGTVTLN